LLLPTRQHKPASNTGSLELLVWYQPMSVTVRSSVSPKALLAAALVRRAEHFELADEPAPAAEVVNRGRQRLNAIEFTTLASSARSCSVVPGM